MVFKRKLNWLFNDVWCYSVIESFDLEIRIFQQTAVKGSSYP